MGFGFMQRITRYVSIKCANGGLMALNCGAAAHRIDITTIWIIFPDHWQVGQCQNTPVIELTTLTHCLHSVSQGSFSNMSSDQPSSVMTWIKEFRIYSIIDYLITNWYFLLDILCRYILWRNHTTSAMEYIIYLSASQIFIVTN